MEKRTKQFYIKCAAVLFLAAVIWMLWNQWYDRREMPVQSGIFEWNEEAVADIPSALELVEQLHLERWYQEVGGRYEEDALGEFVTALHNKNVTVYALMGAPEWGLEEDGEALIENLSPLVSYNEKAEEEAKIDGVMLDVEPYTENVWKEDPAAYMDIYVSCMKEAYGYLKQKGIRTVVCIPRFYDEKGLEEGLEQLIAEACDEVAVMNYGCGKEAEKIQTEERIARKYGKELHCILEFQEVGKHGLTENETYRNKGLEAAGETWDSVQKAYPKTRIIRDYHWTRPVMEMILEQQKEGD